MLWVTGKAITYLVFTHPCIKEEPEDCRGAVMCPQPGTG